jgi:hypothetical protein
MMWRVYKCEKVQEKLHKTGLVGFICFLWQQEGVTSVSSSENKQ